MNIELLQISEKQYNELYDMQQDFNTRLLFLKNKMKLSCYTNSNKCNKCGYCCWRSPCDLNEEDIYRIAEHLKYKSAKEFFQDKLTIQYIIQLDKFTIIPIRINEKCAGQLKPPEYWFLLDYPCVFLNDSDECTINDHKPTCGRNYNCWEKYDDLDAGYFYTKKELENILIKIGI